MGVTKISSDWNIWWTLSIVSAVFTVLVALLEYLGVFGDLAIVLSLLGVVLTILFGLLAASRSSLIALRGSVGELRQDLQLLREDLAGSLARIEQLLREQLPRQPNV